MIPPSNGATRWCENCNEHEAMIRVKEEFGKGNSVTHSWCVECAKIKVLAGG